MSLLFNIQSEPYRPVILALQTDTFGAHGGIPTYNRMVALLLNELEGAVEKRLLIANDSPADLEPYVQELPHLKLQGFSGSRAAFVGRLLRQGLSERIDLALIGHVNYAPLGLLLKWFQPSLRYGVMVHGIDVWSRLPWMRRRALQKADFITSVSEYTKTRVVEVNGVDPNRVYILPNTIEANGRQIKAADPITRIAEAGKTAAPNGQKAISLLSVCRLEANEQYKGVDHVIEALPSVLSQVPNLEYVVIGSGSDLNRHKDLAVECGVEKQVRFMGSISSEMLQKAYRDCDVFVLPSAGEGFGIVFLEAMQDAKPVLAAAEGAAPEVVKHEVTGLLVDYGNPTQLSDALVRLCRDHELRSRFGRAGYLRLKTNYALELFRQRFNEILECEIPTLWRLRRG